MQLPPPRSKPAQHTDRRHTLWITLISVVLLSGPMIGIASGLSSPSAWSLTQVQHDGPIPSSQPWTEDTKLEPTEPRPNEWAGYAVDIDGDTAVVGAPSYPASDRPGRAFIYEHSPDGWTQTATLTGDNPGDLFGRAVLIQEDTLLIGVPRGDTPDSQFAGSVHVYERSTTITTTWVKTAAFTGQDSTLGDEFGFSLALDGDTLVVGAANDEPNDVKGEGSAYVFEQTQTGWSQQAKLIPSDPDRHARFGTAVAVDGDTILVGVRSHDRQATGGGTAFIFERTENGWTETAQLWPDDPGAWHRFGFSVALQHDTAVIGAPGGQFFNHPGAAYVFQRAPEGAWVQTDRLVGDDDPYETFGRSLSLEDDQLAVGAFTSDEFDNPLPSEADPGIQALPSSGAVFVFQNQEDIWHRQSKVVASDRGATGPVSTDDGPPPWDHDSFGFAVALDGDNLLIGAYGDDTETGNQAGSAYLFSHGCTDVHVPAPLTPPAPACIDPTQGGGPA